MPAVTSLVIIYCIAALIRMNCTSKRMRLRDQLAPGNVISTLPWASNSRRWSKGIPPPGVRDHRSPGRLMVVPTDDGFILFQVHGLRASSRDY